MGKHDCLDCTEMFREVHGDDGDPPRVLVANCNPVFACGLWLHSLYFWPPDGEKLKNERCLHRSLSYIFLRENNLMK